MLEGILLKWKGWTAASTLTNISECFDTALYVSLLRWGDPGAVVDPERWLEQLDEDGLVCLQKEEREPHTSFLGYKCVQTDGDDPDGNTLTMPLVGAISSPHLH